MYTMFMQHAKNSGMQPKTIVVHKACSVPAKIVVLMQLDIMQNMLYMQILQAERVMLRRSVQQTWVCPVTDILVLKEKQSQYIDQYNQHK